MLVVKKELSISYNSDSLLVEKCQAYEAIINEFVHNHNSCQ